MFLTDARPIAQCCYAVLSASVYTLVSSDNKTTKIIEIFIKVDHIAMQYKEISLSCSFPDPAKKKQGLVKVQVLHLFLWIT